MTSLTAEYFRRSGWVARRLRYAQIVHSDRAAAELDEDEIKQAPDFHHRSGIGSVIALWPADLPGAVCENLRTKSWLVVSSGGVRSHRGRPRLGRLRSRS
jgi:hypothetical protein